MQTYEQIFGFLYDLNKLKSLDDESLKCCLNLKSYLKHNLQSDIDEKGIQTKNLAKYVTERNNKSKRSCNAPILRVRRRYCDVYTQVRDTLDCTYILYSFHYTPTFIV